uniref:Uncharacterized protein n=1 Tax=viral metagenome TaxID=1070528 RepID=A0A6M3LMQ1_9ZZZZ
MTHTTYEMNSVNTIICELCTKITKLEAVRCFAEAVIDVEADVDVSECGQYVCIAKDEWYEHLAPAIFNLQVALVKWRQK